MNSILKKIVLILLFITAHSALWAQGLLYYNTFNNAESQLKEKDEFSHEKNSFSFYGGIENGKYLFTNKQFTVSTVTNIIPVDYTHNFAIETSLNHADGTETYPFGITFGGRNKVNLCYFGININSQFIVAYLQQGVERPVINWVFNSAIHSGNGKNKLRVEKAGDQMKFYINDIEVGHSTVLPRFGDAVGFMVSGPQAATFDFLKVVDTSPVIAEENKAPQPLNITGTEKGYHTDFKANDDNKWVKKPNDSISESISSEQHFKIQRAAKSGHNEFITGPGLQVNMRRDYLIETQATHLKGAQNHGYGLTFGADSTSGYQFWIANNGLYTIRHYSAAGDKVILPWTAADAINKGDTAKNKISIKHTNGQVAFYVNDQQVNAYPDTYADIIFTAHQFGVSISASQDIGFNYLIFDYLDRTPVIENAPQKTTVAITTPAPVTQPPQTNPPPVSAMQNAAVIPVSQPVQTSAQPVTKPQSEPITTPPVTTMQPSQSITQPVTITPAAQTTPPVSTTQATTTQPAQTTNPAVTSTQPVPVIEPVKPVKDTIAPEIYISSPEVTRGLKIVQNTDVLHITGLAKDPSGVFSVVINGVQALVDKSGNFTADISMDLGDNPILVVATDYNMNRGNYKFTVNRTMMAASTQTAVKQSVMQGKYYALLIAEQEYRDQTIPSLEGPLTDAFALGKSLTTSYTFDEENVKTLKNPTRVELLQALDEMAQRVKTDDNLLIFYAGHGNYVEARQQGYWYPSDAIRTRRDTWISNADLIDYITAIKSKHTLLISDACFSGSIFKARSIEMAPRGIQELYKLPSRKAMTSGTMTEVPDKSVFMEYLLKRLNENTDSFLPSEQLFFSFKSAVVNNSKQVPQFGEIRETGDEGGDFIFIKRN
jgi:hypothetical protein